MSQPPSQNRSPRRRLALFGAAALVLAPMLLFKSACSLVFRQPDQLTQPERMQQLPKGKAPVQAPVKIYWDSHSIPFIEASNDDDLAFALGVVHAHLRIDQIELFRILTKAKISEVLGPIPLLAKLDQGMQVLDFQKAAKTAMQSLSPQSRSWMENFTRGLNHYLANLDERPVTHRLLSIEPSPFTLQEVMAISKLISADLSWATYIQYLRTKEPELFEEFIKKRITDNPTDTPLDAELLSKGVAMFTRSGSNSVVIGGKKSKSGAGLIASDPHVGLMLPNFWLLAGIKSPNYHAVGLMLPGVPILGEGRNMVAAWGGTNMRGISSHLYDVTELDPAQIQTREVKIKRRGWFSKKVEVRSTPFGNVMSDLGLQDERFDHQTLALDWVGHAPSDEIGAFLKASQATTWKEFESAFESYHVSAMNMLYADRHGDIGMVAAYGQPILKDPSKTLDLIKNMDNPRVGVRKPPQHPNPFNPEQGFLASSNNKPFAKPHAPIAFNYANNDRFRRISQLMAQTDKVGVPELEALQLDVYSDSAHKLQRLILDRVQTSGLATDGALDATWKRFQGWNGKFNKESEGAVVFFALMHELWQRYLQQLPPVKRKHLASTDRWKTLLLAWLDEQKTAELQAWVLEALPAAKSCHKEFPTWGQFTIMTPQVMFGYIPGLGRRFRRKHVVAISGSSDTVNKYGRKLSLEQVDVTYGASARHISDLSDPDANYFVLNGGQDGWIFNSNIDDQIPLWERGEYIRVPLRMDAVRRQFTAHLTQWEPAGPIQETGR